MARVPQFIGRLDWGDKRVGTGFLVHGSGLVLTCYHVVQQAAGDAPVGEKFLFEFLETGFAYTAIVTKLDERRDTALLRIEGNLSEHLRPARLAHSHNASQRTAFYSVGYGEVPHEAPGSYDYVPVIGDYAGQAMRDGLKLLRLTANGVLPGTSGSPVIVADLENTVVGMISERFNTDDDHLKNTVWAIPIEACLDIDERIVLELADPEAMRADPPFLREARERETPFDTVLDAYPRGQLLTQKMINEGRSGAAVLLVRINGGEHNGKKAFAKVGPYQDIMREYENHKLAYRDNPAYVPPPLLEYPLGPVEGVVIDQVPMSARGLTLYAPAADRVFDLSSLASMIREGGFPVNEIRRLLDPALASWQLITPHAITIPELLKRLMNLGEENPEDGSPSRFDDLEARVRTYGLPGRNSTQIRFTAGLVGQPADDLTLPNPIAFILRSELWGNPEELRIPWTFVHGDLHAGNVVVRPNAAEQGLWIIDFGQSAQKSLPLFDLAYLELDLVLRTQPTESNDDDDHAWQNWRSLTRHLTSAHVPHGAPDRQDVVITWELVRPIREYLGQYLERWTGSREDFELAWWLAMCVVGVRVARRSGAPSAEQRVCALLYAAAGLKAALQMRRQEIRVGQVADLYWGEEPWDLSREGVPYPGLDPFTARFARVFFGRDDKIDELITMLRDPEQRFLAVTGDSGSGKSSLVRAGLVPRLTAGRDIAEAANWLIVTFKPGFGGANPFEQMAQALCEHPQFRQHFRAPSYLAAELRGAPGRVAEILNRDGTGNPQEILIIIDQFEEVFTLVGEEYRESFIRLIAAMARTEWIRIVITIRSDFLEYCNGWNELAELMSQREMKLGPTRPEALREMIVRPARLAGLTLEDGVVERIQRDANLEKNPKALPLVAHLLQKLAEGDQRQLSRATYDALGGVTGAISREADRVRSRDETDEEFRKRLGEVFKHLVEVDERGVATRKREKKQQFTGPALEMVERLIDLRLLSVHQEGERHVYVEVTHEALLTHWKALADWCAEAQEDLILLRQVRSAAEEWAHKRTAAVDDEARLKVDRQLFWRQERLVLVYAMLERLKPLEFEREKVAAFIEPEQNRLLRDLEALPKDETSHEERRDIGDRLSLIGDTRDGVGVKDGLPDILWLPVEGSNGLYKFEFGEFEVHPFFIARYLITYAQYQVFVDAEDGFRNPLWWDKFPKLYRPQELANQRTKMKNAPRDSVSWYQSVAFAQWMNHRLGGLMLPNSSDDNGTPWVVGENAEIRLPTEWEWQWMAQGGAKEKGYPWTDGGWRLGYANTSEAGLSRTTAVGMYPHGVADCGALDVAGNLFEWCLNDKDNPQIIDGYSNSKYKVLRGGSFIDNQDYAAASFRNFNSPGFRGDLYGLRLVACPIASPDSGTLNAESE